ncbi:alpha/beta fold hydrolase, partial [Zavarzinia sp.]|uniref:alpha/beta fold hydrolase n=1 Tax=Zavarzinia sp. TaxID=2027920 RepID=UPI003568575A
MSRIPLLFLPGLLCDERLWRGQATALADIADARIADLTQDATIAAMAERALATVEGDFALAALSMGGYVAFEILRRAPERVRRLALFDTSAGLDGPEQAKRRKAGLMSLKIGRFVGVTRRFLPELVHASHVDGPVGRTVMEMAEKVGVEAYRHQLQAILGRVDSRPLLPRSRCPPWSRSATATASRRRPKPWRSTAALRARPITSSATAATCRRSKSRRRPAACSAT